MATSLDDVAKLLNDISNIADKALSSALGRLVTSFDAVAIAQNKVGEIQQKVAGVFQRSSKVWVDFAAYLKSFRDATKASFDLLGSTGVTMLGNASVTWKGFLAGLKSLGGAAKTGFKQLVLTGSDAFEKLSGVYDRFLEKIKIVVNVVKTGFNLFRSIGSTVLGFGKDLLVAAGHADRFSQTMSTRFGAKEGKNVASYVNQIARFSEFSRPQLDQYSLQLANAGFGAKDIGTALPAALDMTQYAGGGEGAMSAAVQLIDQIKSTGKVDKGALGQFTDTKTFYAELGSLLGRSAKGAEQAAGHGADPEVLLSALYQTIEKTQHGALGTGAKEAGSSIDAIIARLGGLKEAYLETFANTKGFQNFKTALDTISKALDPMSESGQKIVKKLGEIFDMLFGDMGNGAGIADTLTGAILGILDAVEGAIKFFREWGSLISFLAVAFGAIAIAVGVYSFATKAAAIASSAFNVVIEAGEALLSANPIILIAVAIGAAAVLIYKYWDDISAFFSGLASDIADFFSAAWDFIEGWGIKILGWAKYFNPMFLVASLIWDNWDDIVLFFESVLEYIVNFAPKIIDKVLELGKNIAHGIADGIKGGASWIWENVSRLPGKIYDGVADPMQVQSPSRVMMRLGGHIAQGLADGITNGSGAVDAAMQSMVSPDAGPLDFTPFTMGGGFGGGIQIGTIEMSVQVGDGDSDGELAVRIREQMASGLINQLEELALEAGLL